MEKIKQTSLDQTGIAIFKEKDDYLYIPLFSLSPVEEADDIASYMPGCTKEHVFITNNMMDYKIEDAIKHFRKENENVLPQNLVEELVLGFPFVLNFNETSDLFLYA